MQLKPISRSRLSGEPLGSPTPIIDLYEVPLPGLYVETEQEAAPLRGPVRIIQAPDGLVQLGHAVPSELYNNYGFSGGSNAGYVDYLRSFAAEVTAAFSKNASILEIGCGDGTLLNLLGQSGFTNAIGIDPTAPSTDLSQSHPHQRLTGYFPFDLPTELRAKEYDLIICRHVLEHIEEPHPFLASAVERLSVTGQLWIEVPDLVSTRSNRLWSNFYCLHCNYFEAATLDALLSAHGLCCCDAKLVNVFGGSLFRRYARGQSAASEFHDWSCVRKQVGDWQSSLCEAVEMLPDGAYGFGAAERTAATFGFAPLLPEKLDAIIDNNPAIHGKLMAGTALRIEPASKLPEEPPALVVFALSYVNDILAVLRHRVRPGTLVLIPSDPVRWERI